MYVNIFMFSNKNFLLDLGLSPTIAYSGQKLTRLVTTKAAAKTIKTIPVIPVRVLVKYKPRNIAAKLFY